jgi:hypothetical protein
MRTSPALLILFTDGHVLLTKIDREGKNEGACRNVKYSTQIGKGIHLCIAYVYCVWP